MAGIVSPRDLVVKEKVLEHISRLIDGLYEETIETDRDAEIAVWRVLLQIGRLLLTAVLARRCHQLAMTDIAERGLSKDDVRLRLDSDYRAKVKTTLGDIEVPWFAYRFERGGAYVTCTPSRSVLPLHPRCRSSALLLQWETKLGSERVFRGAEQLLHFVTHGAVSLHDTTIASHCAVVASVVDRQWLYKRPEEIREHLRDHAVRDEKTSKPLLFVSSDAHAERVYEGDTWATAYQMINGIRLWCIDDRTGRIIGLGGEFIVGDCHAVSAAIQDLQRRKILPPDGTYGEGVSAKIVFVADGMPWFDDHILSHFPDTEVVLDAYHVLERLGDIVAILFGAGTAEAKRSYNTLCRFVTGRAPKKKERPKQRKGHKKKHKKRAPYNKPRKFPQWDTAALKAQKLPDHAGGALVAAIQALEVNTSQQQEAVDKLLAYLTTRIDRIQYDLFWDRGFMISSAPMESFHRIAQQRIKRPGATWTPDMVQAILNLRMMSAVGNDQAFWDDAGVRADIVNAFRQKAAA